ncbi:MAG: hypothetical protein ACREIS_01425 [Nitrospiraceae bacterium]
MRTTSGISRPDRGLPEHDPGRGEARGQGDDHWKEFGAPGCLDSLSFDPGNPAKFEQKDESTITPTVPGGKKGMLIVSVTTASREDSKSVLIK